MDLIYRSGRQFIYAFPEVGRCPDGASGEMPVIIPPLAGKSYRGVYEWVWTFAAHDLSVADKVLFVGYSFPSLDAFAEFHLARILRKRDKPVTYILPRGPALNRVKVLLNEIEVTFIPTKWQVRHFEKIL
jgi:hypothetical protein